MMRVLTTILITLLTMTPLSTYAESETFGDYTVHYSAFTTDILTPEVARSYKIPRSKNRVLLNISVLKKVMEIHGSPVKAAIQATATNLTGQLRELRVREIVETGDYQAIYYIAETSVEHNETLKYKLVITPDGEEKPLTVSFQQQFYTK